MSTPCIFPAEIVCEILCYTTQRSVVRWRRVSKWFRTVTHDPKIWKTFHANARFLRPPGPFPTIDFERAFVKSAELARSWTTQGLKTKSRITIPFKGYVTQNRHLIDGRWFVVCQSNRFVLYDTSVDAETRKPRVIWEQDKDIVTWDKYVTACEDGRWIVYLLIKTVDPPKCTLLEIRVDTSAGAPCGTVALDVPASVSEETDEYHTLELDGGQKLFGHSRFLSMPSLSLVFDTRTRTFYELPDFRIALCTTRIHVRTATRTGNGTPDTIVPTNTHVIAIYDFFDDTKTNTYFVVQAFTVPDNPDHLENGKGVLQLSHEGAFEMPDELFLMQGMGYMAIFAMIQNSVIHPRTGSITVKLLGGDPKWGGFDSTCVELTLQGKPSTDNVKRIDVDQKRICIHDSLLYSNNSLHFCNVFYDISDDGYARGFFTRNRDCTEDAGVGVVKFTIDATQGWCTAVISRFWHAGRSGDPIEQLMNDANENMVWDGVKGRLTYIDKAGYRDYVEDGSVVVVDLE